jgi:phage terminase large subunit GpA-like protein
MREEYVNNFLDVVEFGRHNLSTVKPSEWAEQNRSMDSSMSRYQGRFSYSITPYTRDIVDCLSPDHPATTIAVKKGAQIGFSTGVIESGIGWIISQQPGNVLFLTGHADLSEEAVAKVDGMIDSCGIRHLIRSNSKRARNTKTGDTNTKKEFPGGSLVSGSAGNHKLLRQRSCRFGFIDDFDAARGSTKQSGSTRKLIDARFASYGNKRKVFYISTPELLKTSNIQPIYERGDQRKYFIPCPCCGDYITLEWSCDLKNNEKESGERAGITWKLDENNKLIKGSVGYICQECGGFFDDSNKLELMQHGEWRATATAQEDGLYSFHISSLYAPPGMYDWEYYVGQHLEANPPGGKQDEELQKTFVNLCLGEPFEETGEAPKANDLQKNQRGYKVGTIPEKVSINDGNGRIVLVTCACDLNGKVDDARLDFEIVAWAESGSSYSINHGSIGTFIPNESHKKNKVDREKWTYEHHRPNSVWKELEKILNEPILTDTGKKMKVLFTGIDTGFCENEAFNFIDKHSLCVGLKGDKDDKYIPFGVDQADFKVGKSRPNLYVLRSGQIKDRLSKLMRLRWDETTDDEQPSGFMNFPMSEGVKYQFKNFFSHYESEHRIVETKDGKGIASMWVKKTHTAQNHMWDCRYYNMALRDIFVHLFLKEAKIQNGTWDDYVNLIFGKK